jgi:hypothetical protein
MAGVLADAKKSADRKADYQARAKKAWDTRGRNPKLYAAYKARKGPTKSDAETAQATLADPDKARKLNDADLRDATGKGSAPKPEPTVTTGEDGTDLGSGLVTKAVRYTPDQRQVAMEYQQGGAMMDANAELREGRPFSYHRSGERVAQLDKAIAASSLVKDTTFYRTVEPAFAKILEGSAGGEIVDKGFTSMTKTTNAMDGIQDALGFKKAVVIEVRVKAGTKALDMNWALDQHADRSVNGYPEQHEVLLGRGTRYKVIYENGKIVLEAQ